VNERAALEQVSHAADGWGALCLSVPTPSFNAYSLPPNPECNMRDTVGTSWRRLSDMTQKHAGSRSTRGGKSLPVQVKKTPPPETWENEGGRSALSTAPVRILIVDYDIKSSDSLELMLNASGYLETRVAYSGHAALAIAAEFQPSVVLLEHSLLDMSGYEVARLLRERAQGDDLRLIALTSSHELARARGFEPHLLKPVAALDLSGLLPMLGDRDQWSHRRADPAASSRLRR
jgi:CheY-like chemotaxis protein